MGCPVSAPTLPLLARINLCSNSCYPSHRCRLASHRPLIPGAREAVACSTAGSSSALVPPSAFALRFRPSPAAFIPSNRASVRADDDIFVL
uniref:Uncharacterized protein n=1 Tax=Oryza sativa subsp. japonica TaxID=39947 RepID=Q6ERF8_ORYSJ|nr:hypothetical protein [Oryza sativa Japonica Group]